MYCPIALALKEQFPAAAIVVQLDVIRINGITYPTPRRASAYMGHYDSSTIKARVSPINFTLPGNRADDVHIWQRRSPLTGSSIFAETVTVSCRRKLRDVKVGPFPQSGNRELFICPDCQRRQRGSAKYTYHVRGRVTSG
jgi:hypothetical protein